MLGKLSFWHNLFFLSARYPVIAVLGAGLLPGAAMSLRSQHFEVVCSGPCEPLAQPALARLEEVRELLRSLLGPDWVAQRNIILWIPPSEAEWRKLSASSAELGFAETGGSRDWIVINPAANNWREVLAHEYMHVVLHGASTKLETWLEEGICEYYSTIARTGSGILVGRAPSRRKETVDRLGTIRPPTPRAGRLSVDEYSVAWAIVHAWASNADWPRRLDHLRKNPAAWTQEKWPIPRNPGAFPEKEWKQPAPRPSSEIHRLPAAEAEQLAAEAQRHFLAAAGADPWEARFLTASRLLDEGKLAAAIAGLEPACAARPLNSSWWLTLALAYREHGDAQKAQTAAQRALATANTPQEQRAARSFLGDPR